MSDYIGFFEETKLYYFQEEMTEQIKEIEEARSGHGKDRVR